MFNDAIIIALVSLIAGAAILALIVVALRKKADTLPPRFQTEMVAERVRAVGRLIGLEVHAKEIATSKQGWSWVPPILLSQAKLAMIFHFEKQYAVDLARLRPEDITEIGERHYRLRLPPIEGTLRLTDVTPYDIQAGRIAGLIDIIQMNAERQKQLIDAAQHQAAELFERSQSKYESDARRSVEQHLKALMRLVDAEVEITWSSTTPNPVEHLELATDSA